MKTSFHPATLILLWVSVAVLIQTLGITALLLVLMGLLALVWYLRPPRLLGLLKRTRWLFLSLMLVYALTTPGEPLWLLEPLPSASFEGMSEGMLQLLRFVCVLISLSILLAKLSRAALIAGLLFLLYPFKIIGLNNSRLAVRLALTLHYAENAMQQTAQSWQRTLQETLHTENYQPMEIELSVPDFHWRDGLLLSLCAVLLLGIR